MTHTNNRPTLHITWGKAFGEIYCHHASLFIPYVSGSLFSPDIILVGVTVRANNIEKGEINGYSDKEIINYLPCNHVEGGLHIPLNSTPIIDGISLNSWTSLKNGERGAHKEFPIRLIYQVGTDEVNELPFNHSASQTPYILSEKHFSNIKDGEKVDVTINLD